MNITNHPLSTGTVGLEAQDGINRSWWCSGVLEIADGDLIRDPIQVPLLSASERDARLYL